MDEFCAGGLIRSEPIEVELHAGEVIVPAGLDYREALRRLFEGE